jgi:hypothetical protein
MLLACSSSVQSGGSGGGSGTGSTTTGAGGDSSTTGNSTSTGASMMTTTGAGGSGGCGGAYIDVVADNGAPVDFASACNGSQDMEPSGHLFAGGPVGAPMGLTLSGCASMAPMSQGVSFTAFNAMMPGTYTSGTTQYTDASGVTWGMNGDPFSMTVTKLDPVGGAIDGTFTVTVTHGGSAAHNLTGKFHVCHVMDLFAP